MQAAQYSTTFSAPGGSSSRSSSTSYDYGGQDEILKRLNEANQLGVARQGQLYDGDIKGSMVGGQRIRYLLSSLKDITPVRISSQSDSSSSNADGGSVQQSVTHPAEPPITSSDGEGRKPAFVAPEVTNQLRPEPTQRGASKKAASGGWA